MKKIFNAPDQILSDMLEGFAHAHRDIVEWIPPRFIVRRRPKDHGKVGLVIGNGSGHEPAMIGYVGEGLFDVNVVGDIFSAPTPDAILEGMKLADRGAGVLLLVSAHDGDILNARFAMMMAEGEGIRAEMVILYDDISSAPKERMEERRGNAGLFFVWKMVGALAERGGSLEACKALAERVRESTRTLAVAISPGTHPLTGLPMFELPDDEIEVGMGVHGEKGAGRMKKPASRELIAHMAGRILEDKPFAKSEPVLALINNSGSLTFMESYILYRDLAEFLEANQIPIAGRWIGRYATTQEMSGFALSLCAADSEMIELFQSPTCASHANMGG